MADGQASTTPTWRIIPSDGLETAWVTVEGTRLRARGRAAGLVPAPYWVTYELETADDHVTRRLLVEVETAQETRGLELVRGEDGAWRANGEPVAGVGGALDCDLGRCPVTNTMPVLRHRLHQRPGSQDFTMAWVSVPDLTVRPSYQTYTHLRASPDGATVRYGSAREQGAPAAFTAEITLDRDGLVVDYPRLGARVRGT